jgi:hypothetical protein
LTDAIGAGGPGFNNDEEDNGNYRLVTFPQGVDYSALSYDVGGAYIVADTQYPDACYQFIRALSERPALFSSMPARRSVINSPELGQVRGEEAVAFFNALDEQLQQPNIVEFPALVNGGFSQIGDFIASLWLYRAMDSYVLEDADLLSELEDAEQYTNDYLACIADISSFNAQEEDANIQDYVAQFAQCAVNVDESTRRLFVGLNLE